MGFIMEKELSYTDAADSYEKVSPAVHHEIGWVNPDVSYSGLGVFESGIGCSWIQAGI